jgi:hypothetical protein
MKNQNFNASKGVDRDIPYGFEKKETAVQMAKNNLSLFFAHLFKNAFKFFFESLIIMLLLNYLNLEFTYLETMAALVVVRVALPRSASINNSKENVNHVNKQNY